jgi:hypothetical protein
MQALKLPGPNHQLATYPVLCRYVLAFSFIFGDSLKQLFQSAIFLLVSDNPA